MKLFCRQLLPRIALRAPLAAAAQTAVSAEGHAREPGLHDPQRRRALYGGADRMLRKPGTLPIQLRPWGGGAALRPAYQPR